MVDDLLSELTDPFPELAWYTVLARLLVAAVFGGVLGWEREYREKSAGLRTHMMIALAACLFTLLAFELIALETTGEEHLRTDPLRLVEAVTAGVAFLAAGSIITSRGEVRGLTTGAGMWLSGAVGLACGIGQIPLAAMAMAVALVVMGVLRMLER